MPPRCLCRAGVVMATRRSAPGTHSRRTPAPPEGQPALPCSLLDARMRGLAQQLDPFLAPLLRCFFGLSMLLPLLCVHALAACRPRRVSGQFLHGARIFFKEPMR